MKRYLLVLLCIALSCNQPDNGYIQAFTEHYKGDSLYTDTGVTTGEVTPAYLQKKRRLERLFGLTYLEHGFDSLAIRLWAGLLPGRTPPAQVFNIQNVKGKWSGELISYRFTYNDNFSNDEIDSTKIVERKSIQPAGGWTLFINTITELGILSMPDATKVPGYPNAMDVGFVTIEIATRNVYRCYRYQDPYGFRNRNTEAAQMGKILGAFEQAFSVFIFEKRTNE